MDHSKKLLSSAQLIAMRSEGSDVADVGKN